MYVSASLMTFIGFLLPFSGYKWKEWKKVAIYTGIIYISLYSLYTYGSKNIYVDIPLVAWAGGICGWWMNRERKKTDYLFVLPGLILLHFIKASSGLLMAVFSVLFLLSYTLLFEKE